MQLPTTLSDAAQDHLRRGYGGSLHEILRDKEARSLVYKNLPGSRLSEIIRKIRAGRSGLTLEEVVPKPKKKSSETVVVYRVHGNEIASKHPRPAKRR
jgi:hypothetical protein